MNKLAEKYTNIEGWTAIITNTILFALKFWAGIVSGSVAIIADAWHTLSDSFSSIIVLIGGYAAKKPADKKHPFGHGRAEIIASMIVAILLGMIGVEFMKESIERFFVKEFPTYGNIAIIVTTISVIFKEVLAQISIRMGKKVNSSLLIADGKHHRSDAFSSLLILVGIFLGRYLWWIDSALGILVSLVIFYSGYEIIKDNIDHFLGVNADKNLYDKINQICIIKTGKDVKLHHLHLHDYGRHQELSFHIKLKCDVMLKEAHFLATEIEAEIKKQLDITATIHMEPDE